VIGEIKDAARRAIRRLCTSVPDRQRDYCRENEAMVSQAAIGTKKSESLVSDAGLVSKSAIGKKSESAALLI